MRRFVAALVTAVTVLSGGVAAATEEVEVVDILVFTETTAFRHGSITDGVAALELLEQSDALADVDFVAEQANSSTGTFTDENLARFDVVVFLHTTGNPLDTTEQAAFERFVKGGGGFVGVHAAADNEYNWPWYGDLVGGQFQSHPAIAEAALDVEDGDHASTAHLPARWTRSDEWYNFRRNPRKYVCNTEPEIAGVVETQTALEPVPGLPFPFSLVEDPDLQPPAEYDTRAQECGVHVLLTLDESTYANNQDAMGDHPIAWCHDYDGGHAFYTGLGHTSASWTEPAFLGHLTGGLLTAAGLAPCEAPAP